MKYKVEKCNCDKCGNELPDTRNSLNIVTSLSEAPLGWKRLHVRIKLRSGAHNDVTTTDADLCKSCALDLLIDAVNRVRSGERATAGTDDSKQLGWGE